MLVPQCHSLPGAARILETQLEPLTGKVRLRCSKLNRVIKPAASAAFPVTKKKQSPRPLVVVLSRGSWAALHFNHTVDLQSSPTNLSGQMASEECLRLQIDKEFTKTIGIASLVEYAPKWRIWHGELHLLMRHALLDLGQASKRQ